MPKGKLTLPNVPDRLKRLAEDLSIFISLEEVIAFLLGPEARQTLTLAWATDLYWICRRHGQTGQAIHSDHPGWAAAEAELQGEVLCPKCQAKAELVTAEQLAFELAEKLLAQQATKPPASSGQSSRYDTGKPFTYGT